MYWSSWIQTCKTGDQPYSNNSANCQCSLTTFIFIKSVGPNPALLHWQNYSCGIIFYQNVKSYLKAQKTFFLPRCQNHTSKLINRVSFTRLPDLAKIYVFWNSLMVYSVFGKLWVYTITNLLCYWANCLCFNWLSIKKIRSHWFLFITHHHSYQSATNLQDMVRPLKKWLLRHRHNPYPTKAEKVQLAIGSNMSMVQVEKVFRGLFTRSASDAFKLQWTNAFLQRMEIFEFSESALNWRWTKDHLTTG